MTNSNQQILTKLKNSMPAKTTATTSSKNIVDVLPTGKLQGNNWFGNIIAGMTNPQLDLIQTLLQGGYDIGYAIKEAQKGKLGDVLKGQMDMSNYQKPQSNIEASLPPWLRGQALVNGEAAQVAAKPLEHGLTNFATGAGNLLSMGGVGALTNPANSGFGNALISGGAVGTAAGAGGADPESKNFAVDILGKGAVGGLTGAATSGLLYKGGELLNKLKNSGDVAQTQQSLGTIPEKNSGSVALPSKQAAGLQDTQKLIKAAEALQKGDTELATSIMDGTTPVASGPITNTKVWNTLDSTNKLAKSLASGSDVPVRAVDYAQSIRDILTEKSIEPDIIEQIVNKGLQRDFNLTKPMQELLEKGLSLSPNNMSDISLLQKIRPDLSKAQAITMIENGTNDAMGRLMPNADDLASLLPTTTTSKIFDNNILKLGTQAWNINSDIMKKGISVTDLKPQQLLDLSLHESGKSLLSDIIPEYGMLRQVQGGLYPLANAANDTMRGAQQSGSDATITLLAGALTGQGNLITGAAYTGLKSLAPSIAAKLASAVGSVGPSIMNAAQKGLPGLLSSGVTSNLSQVKGSNTSTNQNGVVQGVTGSQQDVQPGATSTQSNQYTPEQMTKLKDLMGQYSKGEADKGIELGKQIAMLMSMAGEDQGTTSMLLKAYNIPDPYNMPGAEETKQINSMESMSNQIDDTIKLIEDNAMAVGQLQNATAPLTNILSGGKREQIDQALQTINSGVNQFTGYSNPIVPNVGMTSTEIIKNLRTLQAQLNLTRQQQSQAYANPSAGSNTLLSNLSGSMP